MGFKTKTNSNSIRAHTSSGFVTQLFNDSFIQNLIKRMTQ
jgi:hypothetical protein